MYRVTTASAGEDDLTDEVEDDCDEDSSELDDLLLKLLEGYETSVAGQRPRPAVPRRQPPSNPGLGTGMLLASTYRPDSAAPRTSGTAAAAAESDHDVQTTWAMPPLTPTRSSSLSPQHTADTPSTSGNHESDRVPAVSRGRLPLPDAFRSEVEWLNHAHKHALWTDSPTRLGRKVVFVPDSSHALKNVKNQLSACLGEAGSKQLLYPILSDDGGLVRTLVPSWRVIERAYEKSRADFTSTLAFPMTHSAVYPDRRSKMAHTPLRLLCNTRTIAFLSRMQQLHRGELGTAAEVEGIIQLLTDLQVLFECMMNNRYPFTTIRDSRLVDVVNVLTKWERQIEVIKQYNFNLSPHEVRKLHFAEPTMQALRRAIHGFTILVHDSGGKPVFFPSTDAVEHWFGYLRSVSPNTHPSPSQCAELTTRGISNKLNRKRLSPAFKSFKSPDHIDVYIPPRTPTKPSSRRRQGVGVSKQFDVRAPWPTTIDDDEHQSHGDSSLIPTRRVCGPSANRQHALGQSVFADATRTLAVISGDRGDKLRQCLALAQLSSIERFITKVSEGVEFDFVRTGSTSGETLVRGGQAWKARATVAFRRLLANVVPAAARVASWKTAAPSLSDHHCTYADTDGSTAAAVSLLVASIAASRIIELKLAVFDQKLQHIREQVVRGMALTMEVCERR